MGSATAASVYGRRFPVTARSHDDPRKLRWGMVDGRSQAQQQLKMAELEEEGRRRSRLPKEEKEEKEEDKPLFGFHFAIAHYNALRAAKKPAVAEAERGVEEGLVWISHGWVSKWPSTVMYNEHLTIIVIKASFPAIR